MKSIAKKFGLAAVAASTFAFSQPAFAGESLGASAQASAEIASTAVIGGAKVVSGAAALPLMAVGEAGKAAGATGDALWDFANAPLPVSNDVIISHGE